MRIIILIVASLIYIVSGYSQTIYQSTSSKITFFAGTPLEDIDATNTRALSFLNKTNGEININIPIRDFHFKRPLMEEHFNENYLESEKFPKATFKGKIDNVEKINFSSSDGVNITVTGSLTLHGVTRQEKINVMLRSTDRKIEGEAKFIIAIADYKIDIPKIVWEKIAEKVTINAVFTYEPFKN